MLCKLCRFLDRYSQHQFKFFFAFFTKWTTTKRQMRTLYNSYKIEFAPQLKKCLLIFRWRFFASCLFWFSRFFRRFNSIYIIKLTMKFVITHIFTFKMELTFMMTERVINIKIDTIWRRKEKNIIEPLETWEWFAFLFALSVYWSKYSCA